MMSDDLDSTDKVRSNALIGDGNLVPENDFDRTVGNNKENLNNQIYKPSKSDSDSAGSMANSVGTGKYAKTNIIWYVVSAVFVIFSCISSAFVVLVLYGYDVSALSNSIKDMWGVFAPVLTLALGYLFAKQGNRNSKKNDQ